MENAEHITSIRARTGICGNVCYQQSLSLSILTNASRARVQGWSYNTSIVKA